MASSEGAGWGVGPFEQVQAATSCIFARFSRLWGAPPYRAGQSLQQYATEALPELVRFCEHVDRLDGFVLTLPREFGDTLVRLADTVGQVLEALVREDPHPNSCLDDREAIGQPDWWLTFAERQFFVLTFAPCYGPEHSRWSFGSDETFILLQPRASFDRRRRGRPSLPSSVHKKIRSLYRRAGQPYDHRLADSDIEAHQFVKPLNLDDPPVRWW